MSLLFSEPLEEGIAVAWDPVRHPRARGGRFAEVLNHIRLNGSHNLGNGVKVERGLLGFRVVHPGGSKAHMSAEGAAQHALDLHSDLARRATGAPHFLMRYKPGGERRSIEDFKVGDRVRQEGYRDPFEVTGHWRGNVALKHPTTGTIHHALPSQLEHATPRDVPAVAALSDTSPERLAQERTDRALHRRRNARAAVTGEPLHYDRAGHRAQGFDDAMAGRPRALGGTAAGYREGYDAGLGERLYAQNPRGGIAPARVHAKAQALVDSGLADDLADARSQLADMGEGGMLAPGGEAGPPKMTRIAAGWYATPDGKHALIGDNPSDVVSKLEADGGDLSHAPGIGTGSATQREWQYVHDPQGRLREDHNAGITHGWHDSKRAAQAAYERHHGELSRQGLASPGGSRHARKIERIKPGGSERFGTVEVRKSPAGDLTVSARGESRQAHSAEHAASMVSSHFQGNGLGPVGEHPDRVAAREDLARARAENDPFSAEVTKAVHRLHDVMGQHPLSREDALAMGRHSPGGERASVTIGGVTYTGAPEMLQVPADYRQFEVAMSRVGRDQRIDDRIQVGATGRLAAEKKAEQIWRDAGNRGRFHTVDVREMPREHPVRDPGEDAADLFNRGMASPGGERVSRAKIGRSGMPVWEGDRLAGLHQIVDRHQAHEIDGHLVDAQTANLLLQVHAALKPENKVKFGTVPLPRLVDLAWGAVR